MRNKGEMSIGKMVTIVLLLTILILGIVSVKKIFEGYEFEITKFSESPCYYYPTNDSIKVHGKEDRQIKVFQNIGKREVILFDETNNKTIPECEAIEVDDWFFICNNSDYLDLTPTDCKLKEYEYPFKTFFGNYDEGNNVITKENINLKFLQENGECAKFSCPSKFEQHNGVKDKCRGLMVYNRDKITDKVCIQYELNQYLIDITR